MTILTASSTACLPRFATPRTSRPTLGPRVAEVGEKLVGGPMMPWQRHVLDVALELDADGHPAYRRVVLTVPRQSGKTTLQLALFVHRALAWGSPQVMVYAAQTGKDARNKLIQPPNGQIPMLKRSPFRSLFTTRLSTGSESVLWRNGSRHSLAASSSQSGHGDTLDLGFIDEAFAQVDARLEQAFTPAMSTRRDAQLWVVSTAGTDMSAYLRAKVNAGRAQCGDTDGGAAYFEWSAPDDADLFDEDAWWGCMPALGFTQTLETTRAEIRTMVAEGNEPEARRAFLNQWRNDLAKVDPLANWAACGSPDASPDPVQALALDVSHDGRSAALVAFGGGAVELVEYRIGEGTGWVPERYAELVRRHRIARHGYSRDSKGAMALAHRLPSGAVEVTGAESSVACAGFGGDVADGALSHRPNRALDKAVAAAVRVSSGEGWRWSAQASVEAKGLDISPLLAAVWARHLGATSPPPVDRSVESLLRSFG